MASLCHPPEQSSYSRKLHIPASCKTIKLIIIRFRNSWHPIPTHAIEFYGIPAHSCIGWCIHVQLNLAMQKKLQFRFRIPELHEYGMTTNSCTSCLFCIGSSIHVQLKLATEIKLQFVQFLPIPALLAYSCIGWCIHVQLNLTIEIKMQFLQFLQFLPIPALLAYSCIGWCIHVQLSIAIEIKMQFLQFLPIPAYSRQFLPTPS